MERLCKITQPDLEYVTEAYLAKLCEDAESWAGDDERTPSWQPLNGDDVDDSANSE